MKNTWQLKKISDVAKICLGLTHTPKYVEEGVPFLSVKDISQGYINFNNTRLISREEFSSMPEGAKPQKDDVLFCRVGTIGYPQIIKEDKEFGIFVSLGFFRVKKEVIFNKYLSYWMESPLFDNQVKKNVQGSTLKNLNTGWLKNFEILLPPIEEQKRIVKILDEVFEKIEEAKENTEKNLQNSRELFEAHLQSIFENPEKDWDEKNLGEVCDFFNGFAFKSKDSVKISNTQLIRMGNLYQNHLDIDRRAVYYPDDFAIKYQKYLLKEDDLIISLTGTTGKEDYGYTVRIPKTDKTLLLNQRIAKIVILNESKTRKDYLLHFLLSRAFLNRLYKIAHGTRQANLSTDIMKNISIIIPKAREQLTIVTKLDALSAETKRLEEIYRQKLADLDELKKSVLQKAFAGEL